MAKGNGAVPSDDGIAIERELPCKLTDDELRMRGDAMAEAELEVDKLKAERRALNKKIFARTDERNKLAHVIDAEEEVRPVICKWIADLDHNAWNLIRQDTGDRVEQRAMTAADRQGVLPLGPSDPGDPDGDAAGQGALTIDDDELDGDDDDGDDDTADPELPDVDLDGPDDELPAQPKPRKRKAAGKAKAKGGGSKGKSKAKRKAHA